MSIQAVAAVLEADVGEVAAKMLLICIANAHNGSTGVCTPDVDRLARESGMSRRSVIRWIDWCVDKHLITVEKRFDAKGRQQANAYVLTLKGGGANLSPRGDTVVTPGGDTVGTPLKKPEEEPELSLSGASEREGMTNLLAVLDVEHATMILDHFEGLGQPLTAYTAGLKAKQLEKDPDPNAASEAMVSKGWKNFKPGWRDKEIGADEKGKAAPPVTPQITELDAAAEPELVAECERQLGHYGNEPREGIRRYTASIVAKARSRMAAA